jgi:glycosyltransferase involved in cell wall biosynthesis
LLDRYAALIVPTVTDEQPRVIFDAFARGLAVLASATSGNRQVVDHARTGLLFTPGDATALAEALAEARRDPDAIAAMGATALAEMAGRTHGAMHAERASAITAALSTTV